MKPENNEFLKQTRKQLDDSAESLDAATLSHLNQARQKALQSHTGRGFTPFRLPAAGIMASISIAMIAAWLWTSQPQQTQQIQLAYDDEDMNMLASDTELELLEELEFVSWLVLEQAPDIDSDIENRLEQNNAG